MSDDLKLPKLPEGWSWTAETGQNTGGPYLALKLRRRDAVYCSAIILNPTKALILEYAEILLDAAESPMADARARQMFKEML